MEVEIIYVVIFLFLLHCLLHFVPLCIQDIGAGKGKYYAVNFPLRDGIDDESYEQIFKPVSVKCAQFHNP